jgi:hypothetical protein
MAMRIMVDIEKMGSVERGLRVLNKMRAKAGKIVRNNRHIKKTQKKAIAAKAAVKRKRKEDLTQQRFKEASRSRWQ